MRKSGLHKQISSIFDGVPVPQDEGVTPPSPVSEQVQETADQSGQPALSPVAETASAPASSTPSLTQRMAGYEAAEEPAPTPEPTPEPIIPAGRPMPLSKNQAALKQKSGVGVLSLAKKKNAPKKAGMDPRQKKMTALIGILSVVFAAVLFVSMGGLSGGQTEAKAATDTQEQTPVQSASKIKEATDWKIPEPIPATLRDPVKPVEKKPEVGLVDSNNLTPGDFSVRGIVFSKSRPSAIVNDAIVTEGKILNGATILKIEKDSVEFEMDGKRWTQQVQR